MPTRCARCACSPPRSCRTSGLAGRSRKRRAPRAPTERISMAREQAPELIVHRGRVLTMDSGGTQAEAFAVAQGRIVVVGSSAEIQALKVAATRELDAEGRVVVPGFI